MRKHKNFKKLKKTLLVISKPTRKNGGDQGLGLTGCGFAGPERWWDATAVPLASIATNVFLNMVKIRHRSQHITQRYTACTDRQLDPFSTDDQWHREI